MWLLPLIALVFSGMVIAARSQEVSSIPPPAFDGYFGSYLEFWLSFWEPATVFAVNQTVSVALNFWNYRVLYIKNITIVALIGNYFIINGTTVFESVPIFDETVVENQTVTLEWSSPGGISRNVNFTPNQTGSLSFDLYGDYEYTEGNQTVEQSNPLYITNLVYIGAVPYGTVLYQNENLATEVSNLSASYQNLKASYNRLLDWALFLVGTTILFILTTAFAIARNRKSRPQNDDRRALSLKLDFKSDLFAVSKNLQRIHLHSNNFSMIVSVNVFNKVLSFRPLSSPFKLENYFSIL
jgi:hypothetical protein